MSGSLVQLAHEGIIVKQSSDAAMHLTPKRNTCTYRNTQVTIGSPRVRCVSAQKIGDNEEEEIDENENRLFSEHSKTVSTFGAEGCFGKAGNRCIAMQANCSA